MFYIYVAAIDQMDSNSSKYKKSYSLLCQWSVD